MRILVINKFCPRHPKAGGAEKHLEEIFSRIAAHDEVHLLAAMFPGAPREETYRHIRIHRLGSARSENTVGIHLRIPVVLRKWLRTLQPDLLVEDVSVVPFFTPLLYPRQRKLVIVHNLNGIQFFRSQRFFYAIIGYLAERLFLLLYRREKVIVVSEWMRRALAAHNFRDVQKVLNGVDETLLTVKKEYAPEPTVLFLGRIENRKGVDLFLHTYPRVKRAVPNVRYIVAGREFGGKSEIIKPEGVEFTGYVSEKGKRELLSRAWLAVVPSRVEGYGIAAIEAAATGTFVIANDTEGLRESVKHGETGVRVDCYDAETFARTMVAWLNKTKLQVQEKYCRAWAAQHHWDASAHELIPATKENVLVTLADEQTIDQAKQLFSSAYWNGGWKGDYLLLAYRIPEQKLRWFTEKGILIKPLSAPPITIQKEEWGSHYPPVVLAKLYVFTEEFKRWKHVLFLDSDIIVRANINPLAAVQGFGAVTDMLPFMENQMNDVARTTITSAVLEVKAFNSGVFCFSTDIITAHTFARICTLADEYQERTIYYPDQAILNIFFKKLWKKIPFFFNVYYLKLPSRYQNHPSKIKCAVLHFAGEYKPWHPHSPCYEEWAKNLRMADAINLMNVQRGLRCTFRVCNPLYYRYLYKIEMNYLYRKLRDKLIKPLGIGVGYFSSDVVLGRGWYMLEYHDTEQKHFIWNAHWSEIFIQSDKVTGVEFDVMLSPLNKKEFTVEAYNGSALVLQHTYRANHHLVHVHIGAKATKIKLSNAVFIPSRREQNSTDVRKLGIMLLSPLILHKNARAISVPLNRVVSYKHYPKSGILD